jgi:hypothetical protein
MMKICQMVFRFNLMNDSICSFVAPVAPPALLTCEVSFSIAEMSPELIKFDTNMNIFHETAQL